MSSREQEQDEESNLVIIFRSYVPFSTIHTSMRLKCGLEVGRSQRRVARMSKLVISTRCTNMDSACKRTSCQPFHALRPLSLVVFSHRVPVWSYMDENGKNALA